MRNDMLLEELVNHVVKSTQHVLMIDPKTNIPSSSGSGCLIIYKERLFFISVQHVTDKSGKQAAIDTGTGNEFGTNILSLPTLNFVDQYHVKGLEIGEPTLQKLKSLDICYTEITNLTEIKQKHIVFENIVVSADFKRIIYSNVDYIPTNEDLFCFYGKIGADIKDNIITQINKLVLGMKYSDKIGPFERFILDEEIKDEHDFKGMSGAPIFSESGELVALVASGIINEKYLYGFSVRELKKYLDLYIDQESTIEAKSISNQILFEVMNRIDNQEINDTNFSIDSEGNEEITEQRISYFDNDFENDFLSQNNYISYPLLYGTNRTYQIKAGKLEYENKRDNKLHLGSCEISIPKSHRMGEIERPNWFVKLLFKESPKKYFTLLKTELIESDRFVSLLAEKIGETDERDVLIFIHGFNVDFNDAMFRAAQLGYDLNFKGCVTAFSWPSVGNIGGYIADMDTAKLSSYYLCDFIKKILQSKKAHKIHIIAHSMGNVVLTNALIQLKEEGIYPNDTINQIILAAPDIDREIFIKQIMPKINRDFGLTLYTSDNDKALITAKMIRYGYFRLGEGGNDITVIDGLHTIDASLVDTSLLGHGYFADTQALLNDIHMTLLDIPPAKRILESRNKIIGEKKSPYWVFRNS